MAVDFRGARIKKPLIPTHRIEQWGRVLFLGTFVECEEKISDWTTRHGNIELTTVPNVGSTTEKFAEIIDKFVMPALHEKNSRDEMTWEDRAQYAEMQHLLSKIRSQ